jgi:phospholipid transport system substrate-binding protein
MGQIVNRQGRRTMHLLLGMLLCACFGLVPVSEAQATPSPEQEISVAVDQLLSEFTTRRGELEGDRPALYDMVDRLTRPYFDFGKISKLVLAQNWKSASPAQREAFGDEFRKLLIRTYATALFQYTGKEKMDFNASEIKERGGRKSATVMSEVRLSEGPPIDVNYYMILGEDGHWKIYNMTIGGVNLVTNYRKTYGASIRSLGLDGLIDSMREANSVNSPG